MNLWLKGVGVSSHHAVSMTTYSDMLVPHLAFKEMARKTIGNVVSIWITQ